MTLTMTLGGHSLPLPDTAGGDPYTVETVLIAPSDRMLDGSLVVDRIAEKHRITVNWRGLTKTQRDNLRNIYDTHLTRNETLVLPDARSYSVAVGGALWTDPAPFYEVNIPDPTNPTPYYDVTMVFDEV